jgi:hypothetical protein
MTSKMVSQLAYLLTFTWSFLFYSLFRSFDQASTKRLAEKIDLQKHEINPLLTRLSKKWGLAWAFRITWVVFAGAIATLDALLNTIGNFGIPALAVLFGSVHLLAAANNIELEYRMKGSSKDQIEGETLRFAQMLSGLDWWSRTKLLTERYAFNFIAAALSLMIYISIVYSDLIGKLSHSIINGNALYNMGMFELFGFLMFFPTLFFGTILLSRRLVKSYKKGEFGTVITQSNPMSVDVPAAIIEEALAAARTSNLSFVRFNLSSSKPGETGLIAE